MNTKDLSRNNFRISNPLSRRKLGVLPLQLAVGLMLLLNSTPTVCAQGNLAESGLLSPTTVCYIEVDAKALASPGPLSSTAGISPLLSNIRTFAGNTNVVVTVNLPFSMAQSVAECHVLRDEATSLEEINERLRRAEMGPAYVRGDYWTVSLAGNNSQQESLALDSSQGAGRARHFEAAIKSCASYPIRIAAVPPEYLRRTFVELVPQLPPELGGGPIATLTDGIQWAGIGVDPKQVVTHTLIQSANESAAEELAKALPKLWEASTKFFQGNNLEAAREMLEWMGRDLKMEVQQSQIHIHSSAGESTVELANQFLDLVVLPMHTRQKTNRFRQLLLAFHNFESATKYLTPGPKHRDEEGRLHLSWRVYLLPYLGEVELYQKFRLDEPWDSEHNMKLLEKMPDAYKLPSGMQGSTATPKGHTVFAAPSSERTIVRPRKATKFGHVTDGASNTILVVELDPKFSVPWTAPQDYEFDPADPVNGLRIAADGTFECGLGDGSSQRIPGSIKSERLLHLFEMNDSQVTQR